MPESFVPEHLRFEPALACFAMAGETQSQRHIKPLHQYVALRLVIEGGFHPDEITPHPPLAAEVRRGIYRLVFDKEAEEDRESTVLGGLKSKDIDVVVNKPGVGPVVAISIKGTVKAFRNLTNRMEEAVGDATNLHIMYPGLVYGFLHFLKGNRAGTPGLESDDVAVPREGAVVSSIQRYHDVLLGLAGRKFVRDEASRYEAVGLAMADPEAKQVGRLLEGFPAVDSSLNLIHFFAALYQTYDLRFPYTFSIKELGRLRWASDSPALGIHGNKAQSATAIEYQPRIN